MNDMRDEMLDSLRELHAVVALKFPTGIRDGDAFRARWNAAVTRAANNIEANTGPTYCAHDNWPNECPTCQVARDKQDAARLERIEHAARQLYDNRLGWSDGRNPYAPPEFWNDLAIALSPPNEAGHEG